jgi:EAL and modified HD-GYP domain-containing signal transduction protein
MKAQSAAISRYEAATARYEADASDEHSGILLTYKPIFGPDRQVAAYQVILDHNGCGDARLIDDLASTLVLDTYADIYQNGHLETVPHFLPVPFQWLTDSRILSLPKAQYILEFDASGRLPEKLPEHLHALAHRGYQLALSDYDPARESWTPVLDIVDFVRLDLRHLGLAQLTDMAGELFFHHVQLLVEGVHNLSEYHACTTLGITRFQGHFLNRVATGERKRLPSNVLVPIELLAELNNPDTTPEMLGGILVKDARLSFRILKIINSAAVGLQRHVDSLADAIALLGTNELERWASLLLMQDDPNTPDELTRSALIRGHMCEDIAKMSGQDGTAQFFTVGLLSQLDALTGIPMTELMQQVPLSAKVKQALLDRTGMPGQILTEVEAFLDGHFDRLRGLVDPYLYTVSYQRSVAWARQMQQVLAE